MRYFVQLSYKGTSFHGWQVQPNAQSVQERLNKAFSTLLKHETELVGAGRTDSGVHASYYIAHFDTDKQISDYEDFIFHLNCLLPLDIAIQNIRQVKDDAHARFDAISRTYQYHIHTKKNPFFQDRSWFFSTPLNMESMNDAANILIEYQDFTSFCKLHSDNMTNLCKIYEAKWETIDERLVFTIKADRFLRNMVRAIVGTLLEVGKGKMDLEGFRAVIEGKDRCKAGTSVPAHGLFLTGIEYPESTYQQ